MFLVKTSTIVSGLLIGEWHPKLHPARLIIQLKSYFRLCRWRSVCVCLVEGGGLVVVIMGANILSGWRSMSSRQIKCSKQ